MTPSRHRTTTGMKYGGASCQILWVVIAQKLSCSSQTCDPSSGVGTAKSVNTTTTFMGPVGRSAIFVMSPPTFSSSNKSAGINLSWLCEAQLRDHICSFGKRAACRKSLFVATFSSAQLCPVPRLSCVPFTWLPT